MTFPVTLYKHPHGQTETVQTIGAAEADTQWLHDMNIAVSMEDAPMGIILYANCGHRLADEPEEDPDEIICLAGRETYAQAIAELVVLTKSRLKTDRPRFPVITLYEQEPANAPL